MSSVQIITEKKFFTELLQMYKKRRCLWDHRHMDYHDRESRNRAYAELLEKYKTIYENATLDMVRSKIENMRTGARRERKKVIASKLRNEDPCYTPRLWYYKHMLFLEGQYKNELAKTDQSSDSDDNEEELIESQSRLESDSSNQQLDEVLPYEENGDIKVEYYESDTEEPTPKKPALTSVFVADEENTKENTFTDFVSTDSLNPQDTEVDESEAYGRAVGLQLKQLDGFQRTVAEKIISDAIFYARLNKLTANSYINLNAD